MYDLIIIGAGPGGYVAGIRAGQIGLKSAIIDKSNVGGMCLNWGCIPTKALIESAKRLDAVKNAEVFGVDGIDKKSITFNWKKAIKRSDRIVNKLTKGVGFLLQKNGVEVIQGEASIKSANSISVNNRLLETKNIIIATGSRPKKTDFPVPDELVIEIDDMLKLDDAPDNILVTGCNPHAVELAQFFQMIGKKVKLALNGDELLPGVDPYLSDYIQKSFKKWKIEVFPHAEISGYENGEIIIGENRFACNAVINASRRVGIVPQMSLDLADEDYNIIVDSHLRTKADNIYAVGDVTGKSRFAHSASAQGLHAVNSISGIDEEFDFHKSPINIYTNPEIAQIGLTEPLLKEKGIDYKISEFPLSANGKALTEGNLEGFIRLLSDKKYGEVIGVQIVAPHATDMISEASMLMQLEGTVYDVAGTIHAHPTVSEIYMESGFAAFDQPIHK